MTRDTREYGEKLIEAGARKIMDALTLKGDVSASERALVRVLYNVLLDKLVSEGPSEGMHAASFRELRCHVHDLDWAEDTFGKAFTAMLRTLRTEIAEER